MARFNKQTTMTGRKAPLLATSAIALALLAIAGTLAAAPAARADLKLCNDTASRVGVAIGYHDTAGEPASEGWWTIASQTCEVLLRGGIPSRLIYVRAVDYDQGGGWTGGTKLCTQKGRFAIRGIRDCATHGYQSEGFMEVDTGGSKQWTIRLADPEKQGDGGS